MSTKDYLLSFVVGSSFPASIIFFNAVTNYKKSRMSNVNYYHYSKITPIYLGILNMFGLYLAQKFNLSDRMRFLLISVIGIIIIGTSIQFLGTYNFTTKEEWIKHYFGMTIIYLFVFNVVIFYLEYFLKC